ncbi:glutaredoxin family protein [Pseudogracilibacillus sp. SO30301A]|uniref:glutaredoxin family protein n=1 Tax=Pseudogracilibacillus sp. SO30301A TaxID=3098291 RepID=UPI00300DD68D
MVKLEFYTKHNCSLCDDAYALIMMLKNYYSFELEERDIYTNDSWLEEYQLLIPAVRIKDTFLTCEKMNLKQLEKALQENIEIND